MTVDTPAWVRDAVFYQIFPDRFAASAARAEARPAGAVGRPADEPRVQGRRPAGHRRAARLPRGPRRHGAVPDADLPVGVEPPLPHVRLLPRRPAARRRRGAPRAARRRPRAAGCGSILDGVFNHTGRGFWPFHHILENGAASPYRDWFHIDPDVLEGRREFLPYPPRDAPHGAPLGYEAWWGLPALPKLNTDHPEVREYLLSVAEHWLRFGIDGWRLDVPDEIDDPAFWAAFRQRCRAVRADAYLVGEIWVTAPEWVAGDRFDALMNYPLAEAILGYVGGSSAGHGAVVPAHERVPRPPPSARRPRVRRPARRACSASTTRTWSPSSSTCSARHDTPRALTVLGGDLRGAAGWPSCSRCFLPGAPCIYYGDEVGLDRRHRPGQPRRLPVGRGALGPRATGVRPRGARVAGRRAGTPARCDVRRSGRRAGDGARASARRRAAGPGAQRRRRSRRDLEVTARRRRSWPARTGRARSAERARRTLSGIADGRATVRIPPRTALVSARRAGWRLTVAASGARLYFPACG